MPRPGIQFENCLTTSFQINRKYKNGMEETVLAIVANYDFSENADVLKACLSRYYKTLLLDNSSPTPPRTVDIILPNHRYVGLWNASVRLALDYNKQWLLFVASDIQIPDVDLLATCLRTVLKKSSVGIYTPSLKLDSRLAYPACFQRKTGKLRECYVTEGFFFLARTKILERLYPVALEVNRFGFGIDLMTAYNAYRTGYKVVVDDRVVIHHPAAIHATPNDQAVEEQMKYMGPEGRRFMKWLFQRLKREGRLSEIPCRLAMICSRPFLRTYKTFFGGHHKPILSAN
jgi:hypothetical protein